MTAAPHPVLRKYYQRDADRRSFVTALFDGAARHYDRVCTVMSLGSGQWYRRTALGRAGLRPGMRLLDVATGTGLVARSALPALGEGGTVIGLDASAGMLREARKVLPGPLVQGRVEALPLAAETFDLVSVGYALRHVADLDTAFRECRRVLRPGGRLLLLELSRAPSPASRWLLGVYFRHVLPLVLGLGPGGGAVRTLTRYYWDTIVSCVPPETILEALRRSGFVDVGRRVYGGFVSEYVGMRPEAVRPQRMAISAGSTPRRP